MDRRDANRPGVNGPRGVLAASVAGVLLLAGCGGPADPPPGTGGADGVRGRLTVFAAASLTESFTRLGKDFEAAYPGTTVTISFAGSSALAAQINQGAPADVFAAAAAANMRTVVAAGNADGKPAVFARNQLVIAVPQGNPRRVAALADLTAPGLKVALCAAQVPCGAAARDVLSAAKIELTPVTLEPDVKAALAKVRLGEVDAALVYRTDIGPAGDTVDCVEFPESASAVNDYPIVVITGAPNPGAARAFVAHVRSPAGQAVLTATGFQAP